MKLFGKKTLALALALTMVLSLCPFTAFGADFAISGDSEVYKGETITLTTSAEDASKVTWEVTSGNDYAEVSTAGVVTGKAAGVATVKATYTPEGESATPATVATKQITVKVRVEGVTLNYTEEQTTTIGKQIELKATVTPQDAPQDVVWYPDNTAVVRVSDNGTVTAIKEGSATITAESKANSAAKKSVKVTVIADTIDTTGTQLKNASDAAQNIPYGTSLSDVKAKLATLPISVKYSQGGTAEATATDWACEGYASNGKNTVKSTYTFTSATYGVSVTVTMTKSAVKSASVEAKYREIIAVKGTQQNSLGLSTAATLTLESGATVPISIGPGSDYSWVCVSKDGKAGTYDPNQPGVYKFQAKPNAGVELTNFTMDKYPEATVYVSAYVPINTSDTLIYTGDDTYDLKTLISNEIEKYTKDHAVTGTTPAKFSKVDSITPMVGTYGTVSSTYYRYSVTTVGAAKLMANSGKGKETFNYVAYDTNSVEYRGQIELTITSSLKDVTAESNSSNPIVRFGNISSQIEKAFYAVHGEDAYTIVLGNSTGNGGAILTGSGDDAEGEELSFSKSDDYDKFEDCYFLPNGEGGTFKIKYTAYAKNSTRTKMEGTITIDCKKMLVVWLNDMGLGETQNLSASAIQEQVDEILNTKKISYTLDTVTIKTSSVSGGKVVDANNKVVSTSKKIDAADLDDYAYQAPSKMPSSGDPLVVIRFNATETADTGRKGDNEDLGGVMLFNLTKKADITITAPANDAAVLGTDVFQTYFEKNASSTYRKNYDACYVVFSGAPNSNTSGYLYDGYKSGIINGSKIKSPNGKKFALTDISAYDKHAYDLSNTYYVPGSRNCTGGTFEIYGVKSGTTIKSSTRFTKLCEGSIDYVVGSAAAAITGTINASNYMQMTPSAFTKTNKNASYVVFTAQPAGGKLVYNYNRTTPGVVKEISLNTPYYITYSAANANYYLGYVSFVPAYTAVKGVTSVVDIPCTIYSTSKVGTACSVKISVVSATKSAKFTDVGVAYMPYADSIDFLYNCGITTGTSTTGSLYNPSGSVTRGEWITMLYRAAGSPKMSNKIPFTDVTAKNSYSWCYDAVRWAYQNNICQGTGATTFSPAMKLDRQQIVTFMYNYAVKYNGGNGAGSSINGYTDSASVASWAKAPMEWAVKNQYYTVVGTRLQPTDSANRAEVALYMHRLLTY